MLPSATHSGVQKHSYYTEQLSNILQPPFSHPSVGKNMSEVGTRNGTRKAWHLGCDDCRPS